jgi:hypothetical protein
MTDTIHGKPTSKELKAWADYQRSLSQDAPEALVDESYPFETNKQFDDGRGNNFDPSWKDRF